MNSEYKNNNKNKIFPNIRNLSNKQIQHPLMG
jgi:hypothetical protein